MDVEEVGWGHKLDWCGSGCGQVAGCCECCNELSWFPKMWVNFLSRQSMVSFSRRTLLCVVKETLTINCGWLHLAFLHFDVTGLPEELLSYDFALWGSCKWIRQMGSGQTAEWIAVIPLRMDTLSEYPIHSFVNERWRQSAQTFITERDDVES
jgi:hypothetical protein